MIVNDKKMTVNYKFMEINWNTNLYRCVNLIKEFCHFYRSWLYYSIFTRKSRPANTLSRPDDKLSNQANTLSRPADTIRDFKNRAIVICERDCYCEICDFLLMDGIFPTLSNFMKTVLTMQTHLCSSPNFKKAFLRCKSWIV